MDGRTGDPNVALSQPPRTGAIIQQRDANIANRKPLSAIAQESQGTWQFPWENPQIPAELHTVVQAPGDQMIYFQTLC